LGLEATLEGATILNQFFNTKQERAVAEELEVPFLSHRCP
jgi:hypothetical protein